jgi:hypothetical protein
MSPFLDELMKSDNINTIIEPDGNVYGIRVLGRGSDLFFKENERGLICAIDALNGIIYTKSIKSWDSTGEKIKKDERERLIKLIEKYYKQVYNMKVELQ